MEKLKITFRDKIYETTPLITTEEFIQEHDLNVVDPMAVIINGRFTRLSKKLRVNSTVEFIELGTTQGKRIYEASVLFLFMVAFAKKYPDANVFVQHSIHKGVYAEIDGADLQESDVKELDKYMKDIVKQDLPIKRVAQDWDLAMSEMREQDRQDMLNLYKYKSPTTFKFYELEGVKEALYLPLVPSTKDLGHFELVKYQDGVVVVFPDFKPEKDVPKFVDKPKLFATYKEYHEWSRILKVRTVGQLNKYIMNNQISELIKIAEALHEKRVVQIVEEITNRPKVPRLILIAGPTSSGKTTFSKRLGVQLKVSGFKPVAISMDNYFVDREHTPKDAEGNYDFESLEAIDVPLFMEHITKLLAGEEIELPRFDFHSGTKSPSGKMMKLKSNQIIIIEGIHGINPKLTTSIASEDKFKIYISALTQLNLHRHDRIQASDTRLIRRIVRDNFFRGYSASDTLGRWKSVRDGEKKNIFPLQEEADTVYNSALFYELAVLKVYAERELLRVEKDDPMYADAQRLLRLLSHLLPLTSNDIPSTSILKEFIGGSTFDY